MSAPSSESRVALVRDGIAATNRGDIDAVLDLFDPELEFHIATPLGNAGTYHGRDGYKEGLGGWLEAWEDFTIELEDVEPVGDRHVVCAARQSARGRGSGVEVEMRLGYMFEFRGDRVIRLHIVDSRDDALAAVSEQEQSD